MGTFPVVMVALAAVWRAVIMILQGDLDRQYLETGSGFLLIYINKNWKAGKGVTSTDLGLRPHLKRNKCRNCRCSS